MDTDEDAAAMAVGTGVVVGGDAGVGVAVSAGAGVGVETGVGVSVGVETGVSVGVDDGVEVGVGVSVGVGDSVGVGMGVIVGTGTSELLLSSEVAAFRNPGPVPLLCAGGPDGPPLDSPGGELPLFADDSECPPIDDPERVPPTRPTSKTSDRRLTIEVVRIKRRKQSV